MGVYLNPGNRQFQKSVRSPIYVDKTPMIQYLNSVLNTEQGYVSVSRPRRFGKTMAANMVCAYYDRTAESRSLFERTLLPQCEPVVVGGEEIRWDSYLKKFDVVHLTMTDFFGEESSIADSIKYLREEVAGELMDEYPDVRYGKRITLRTVMAKIFAKHKKQFVVVIDEWDAIFRYHEKDFEGQKLFLDNLRNWLKDKPYIALAYMTGILPIKKYGKHSALNMFEEYSMMYPMQLAKYFGFTEQEVTQLCEQRGRDFQGFKRWYDGYVLNEYVPEKEEDGSIACQVVDPIPDVPGYHIYSPLSVLKAIKYRSLLNYWNETETYEALNIYIQRNYDGLKDAIALLMNGGRIRIDTSTYQNDMTTFHNKDDVLSLLVHLGYLGFDNWSNEVFIPNKEVMETFKTSTKNNSHWTESFSSLRISQELLNATWEGDEAMVADLVEKAHDNASNLTYNDEAALSYGVQLAYYAAQGYYTDIKELDTGKGYADLVYLPSPHFADKPVLLIELKYGKGTDAAMDQVRKKEYLARLGHYKGNILVVGINYDKDVPSTNPSHKHHTCRIEKA